jgi:deoxyribose-phosphate aldolase
MCYDVSTARNSREHNNANVLTLGAGMIGRALAEQIVDAWLSWECTADRHKRRVGMIDALDGGRSSSGGGAGGSCGCGGTGGSCSCGGQLGGGTVSDEDIVRIAARIAEKQSSNGAPGVSSAQCTDPLCTVCKVCVDIDPASAKQLLEAGANRIGHRAGQAPLPAELSKFIDHTLLKPEATVEDVRKLCGEAREYHFASVCVNPTYVALAAKELANTDVIVCAVVGFPLGAHMPEIKAMEARRAIREGAREIDMVINVGALKSGLCDLVLRDIRAVTDACLERGVVCKVILETASLTDDEKFTACQLAKRARADFVKTSTGFGSGGATVHDVALMAEAVRGTAIGVKASGGIRDLAQANEMIAAGATRLGVSAGIKIIKESKGITVSDGGGGGKY